MRGSAAHPPFAPEVRDSDIPSLPNPVSLARVAAQCAVPGPGPDPGSAHFFSAATTKMACR